MVMMVVTAATMSHVRKTHPQPLPGGRGILGRIVGYFKKG